MKRISIKKYYRCRTGVCSFNLIFCGFLKILPALKAVVTQNNKFYYRFDIHNFVDKNNKIIIIFVSLKTTRKTLSVELLIIQSS